MLTILGCISLAACLIALVGSALYWTVRLSNVIPHVDQHTDSRDYITNFGLFPWTKP